MANDELPFTVVTFDKKSMSRAPWFLSEAVLIPCGPYNPTVYVAINVRKKDSEDNEGFILVGDGGRRVVAYIRDDETFEGVRCTGGVIVSALVEDEDGNMREQFTMYWRNHGCRYGRVTFFPDTFDPMDPIATAIFAEEDYPLEKMGSFYSDVDTAITATSNGDPMIYHYESDAEDPTTNNCFVDPDMNLISKGDRIRGRTWDNHPVTYDLNAYYDGVDVIDRDLRSKKEKRKAPAIYWGDRLFVITADGVVPIPSEAHPEIPHRPIPHQTFDYTDHVWWPHIDAPAVIEMTDRFVVLSPNPLYNHEHYKAALTLATILHVIATPTRDFSLSGRLRLLSIQPLVLRILYNYMIRDSGTDAAKYVAALAMSGQQDRLDAFVRTHIPFPSDPVVAPGPDGSMVALYTPPRVVHKQECPLYMDAMPLVVPDLIKHWLDDEHEFFIF